MVAPSSNYFRSFEIKPDITSSDCTTKKRILTTFWFKTCKNCKTCYYHGLSQPERNIFDLSLCEYNPLFLRWYWSLGQRLLRKFQNRTLNRTGCFIETLQKFFFRNIFISLYSARHNMARPNVTWGQFVTLIYLCHMVYVVLANTYFELHIRENKQKKQTQKVNALQCK